MKSYKNAECRIFFERLFGLAQKKLTEEFIRRENERERET
jgi:hypothetical protein